MKAPQSVYTHVNEIAARVEQYSPKLAQLYRNCYPNTLETALKPQPDGTYFVLTGDIPAMWLRDSTAQVSHYVPLAAQDDEVKKIIRGVIVKQLQSIIRDPYANAFNESDNGNGHGDDLPKNSPWVWERKYEIDSLCYPIRLLGLYVDATGDKTVLDDTFLAAAEAIVALWTREQHHNESSPYRFIRPRCSEDSTDTIHNGGLGAPVACTGMTWSGFRPSDDGCTYGYLIASEFFAVKSLGVLSDLLGDCPLAAQAKQLAQEIKDGIRKYGVVRHPQYGEIYACETDGMGHYVCMDDANVPSLLSLPYLGCIPVNDEIYQNTRRFILSRDNPYYFEGKVARGVGSPHTPNGYVWHIALSMQGLTATDPDEVKTILSMMAASDADTGFMHEGFDANDPTRFSRPWFTWSNSLFAEFVESAVARHIIP